MQPDAASNASSRPLLESLWRTRYAGLYLVLTVWFTRHIVEFHDAHTGFTPLIGFGRYFAPWRLPVLRDLPLYTYPPTGADGQFYAQLAVADHPLEPALGVAIDAPAYRTRRILLSRVAHFVGLGRPSWVLTVYALSNLACWLLLAWALARWWFPPTDLDNALRWVGVLLGAGMVVSVSESFTDGPALLVLAAALRAAERGRLRLGAVLVGAAGLVRETSILAVSLLLPPTFARDRRAWLRAAAAILVGLLPPIVWSQIVTAHYGSVGSARSLDMLPFAGLVGKIHALYVKGRAHGIYAHLVREWVAVLAIVIQSVVVLARPSLKLGAFRLGAPFVAVVALVSLPVWDDSSAACRAALPLTLAFNLIVPRTRSGLALLVLGNLTVFWAVDHFGEPAEQTYFTHDVTCGYGDGWYQREILGRRTWRWAKGPTAAIDFHNPNPTPVRVALDFEIASDVARDVEVRSGDTDERIPLQGRHRVPARFGPFLAPPGDTRVTFNSPDPALVETAPTGRKLTFSIHNLWANVAASTPTPTPTPTPSH